MEANRKGRKRASKWLKVWAINWVGKRRKLFKYFRDEIGYIIFLKRLTFVCEETTSPDRLG